MQLAFAKRIICDSKILGGKPVVKGTRISVEFILGLLQSGLSLNEIIREYPHLTRADLEAALAFSKQRLAGEEIIPLERVKARP